MYWPNLSNHLPFDWTPITPMQGESSPNCAATVLKSLNAHEQWLKKYLFKNIPLKCLLSTCNKILSCNIPLCELDFETLNEMVASRFHVYLTHVLIGMATGEDVAVSLQFSRICFAMNHF